MLTITTHDKTVTLFPSAQPDAPVVYLNTFGAEGQQVYAALRSKKLPAFSLVAISDLDWNRDMVPWDAPPVFKNTEPFCGGADGYLQLLTHTILPVAEKELPGKPCWRGLAGYSLAGLFALYALYRTDCFSRFASISGSLWFPGMQAFVFSRQALCLPECLYFSLGDKESRTRNPAMRTVREATEAIHAYYRAKGIRTMFQLNPGNHFQHAAERTAAGIAWLLTQ